MKASRTDVAAWKRTVRKQREKGVSLFISGEALEACGIDPNEPPPLYKLWPGASERRGRIVVELKRA